MTKTRCTKKPRRIIIHLSKQKQNNTSVIKQAIIDASNEMDHNALDTPISEFMKGMLKICFVNKFVLIAVAFLCTLFV